MCASRIRAGARAAGQSQRPKTDRLDARWLVLLLAREMLPESWLPPEEIQRLRDQTRLRKALADDRTRWAQRLHALLVHEGWPCSRGSLLTARAALGSRVAPARAARPQVDSLLAVMAALEAADRAVDAELRRFARADERLPGAAGNLWRRADPRLHLLAEIGDASRFRRAGRSPAWPASTPSSSESAETRRRGHLAKAGSPHLRWALVEAAVHAHRATAPDLGSTARHASGATPRRPLDRRAQDRQARLPRLRELESAA